MIYLPPPQPVLNKDVRIGGEVEIHPTASLASGVILQAAPDCRIVIGADVCIGMGVIINAVDGEINIANGAILGSGVLIIGGCEIGENSCIGTSSTILQSNVEAMTVIPPGSIIGDSSRQVESTESENSQPESQGRKDFDFSKDQKKGQKKKYQTANGYGFIAQPSPTPTQGFQPNKGVSNSGFKSSFNSSFNDSTSNTIPSNSAAPPQPVEPQTSTEPLIKSEKLPVVGQVYLNELLITLFPHSKDANHNTNRST